MLLLCLILVGGAVAWRMWPRTVPADRCSAVYRHYAVVEGVDASFIKDKHIGGEQVDVTLLHAADSKAWECLMRDLDMPDFDIEADDDCFVHYCAAREHPELRVPFAPGLSDLVVLWPAGREVCIFHIDSEAQYDRLLKQQFDKIED